MKQTYIRSQWSPLPFKAILVDEIHSSHVKEFHRKMKDFYIDFTSGSLCHGISLCWPSERFERNCCVCFKHYCTVVNNQFSFLSDKLSVHFTIVTAPFKSNWHFYFWSITPRRCDLDIHCGRASEQWLNPPVASDYVSVVYFSWPDASWRQQSLADKRSLSPMTDQIDWHTLFDSLRVAWSRISFSGIGFTHSYCEVNA